MTALRAVLDALRNLLTWWITVAPWEQAIRVRLGKHVQLLEAGVHLRIPVADRIYRQSTRRRNSALPAQTLITKDGKPLTVAVMVGYRISDLLRLYETLHHAEATISCIVLGAVGEFVVARESSDCGPGELAREVIRAADLGRYGLDDIAVTVTSFAFVRTYRFITGDGNCWSIGDHLDTSREDLEARSQATAVIG